MTHMSSKVIAVLLLIGMIVTIVTLDVLFLRDHFTARLITNICVAAVFLGIATLVIKK